MVSSKNDPGYERAIAAVKERHGIDRGAAAWLASQLGTSRQRFFYFKRVGFPPEVAAKIAKILEIEKTDVARVATLKIDIPKPAWEQICATSPKSATDQAKVR